MISKDKIEEIERLKAEIGSHGKLPEDVLKKINYKLRLEWNYTSNSMEGNTLTRDETRSVMVGVIDVNEKPIKDVMEMKGHDDVIRKIMDIGKGELNLSESRIKEIHKAIMHEEDPEKAKEIGKWKTRHNQIINYRGEKFDFSPPAEVPERMHKLINWLNAEKEKLERFDKTALHPAEIAFKFHLDYVTIHPFYDGNGRTARIFTNLILISYGLPPLYIKSSEKDIYGNYLGDIQGYGGEPGLFYDFMAGLLIRSLQLTLDAIEGKEIEEPDDVDKEIEMLKRKLLYKSQDTDPETVIIHLISSDIFPFLEKINAALREVDDFFTTKDHVLTADGLPYPYTTMIWGSGDFETAKNAIKEFSNITSLKFLLHWKGFKYSKTHSHELQLDSDIEFSKDLYIVHFLFEGKTYKISKKYDERLNEEEIANMTRALKKDALEILKGFVN